MACAMGAGLAAPSELEPDSPMAGLLAPLSAVISAVVLAALPGALPALPTATPRVPWSVMLRACPLLVEPSSMPQLGQSSVLPSVFQSALQWGSSRVGPM